MCENTIGENNSAFGTNSLQQNRTGNENTSIGFQTLYRNVSGTSNTAVGIKALYNNQIGSGNVALGGFALNNSTGDNNVALGGGAGQSLSSGVNNIIISYDAQASSSTISNEITLGNANITNLRANVTSISSLSDSRDKKNINDLNVGLNFINSLKPRVFNWDKREWYKTGVSDGSKISKEQTAGFIAQELDETQNKFNADWLKLVYKSNPNKWEATYGNLLPVVVKSIQELSKENTELKDLNKSLENRINKLESLMQKLLDEKK